MSRIRKMQDILFVVLLYDDLLAIDNVQAFL